jgi:hypothetical protein
VLLSAQRHPPRRQQPNLTCPRSRGSFACQSSSGPAEEPCLVETGAPTRRPYIERRFQRPILDGPTAQNQPRRCPRLERAAREQSCRSQIEHQLEARRAPPRRSARKPLLHREALFTPENSQPPRRFYKTLTRPRLNPSVSRCRVSSGSAVSAPGQPFMDCGRALPRRQT